jgi:hypothetical protein
MPRNHSLTYREKNCRRGRLRPRLHNLEDVKEFRYQAVHDIFHVVKSNGRESGFRGLFYVREVLVREIHNLHV